MFGNELCIGSNLNDLKYKNKMEAIDELKEMLVNNAANWGKKEGDDMAEIYVDDFLNELLSKFKLLPIHAVSKCDCDKDIACIVCGEEKALDGDFWKRMKEQ